MEACVVARCGGEAVTRIILTQYDSRGMTVAMTQLLGRLTVDDVARAGACRSGVRDAFAAVDPLATSIAITDELLASLPAESAKWACIASGRSGDGADCPDAVVGRHPRPESLTRPPWEARWCP